MCGSDSIAQEGVCSWADSGEGQALVPQELACFQVTCHTGESRPIVICHVPRTTQAACDPGIAVLRGRLGLEYTEENADEPLWDHVGLHLFSSAILVGQYLLAECGRKLLRGKRVLDLGCGVGLLGPVAVMAGAREVVLTDFDPVVLHLCRHNMKLNETQLKAVCPSLVRPLVQDLDWRDVDAVSSNGDAARQLLCGVDLLLASDDIYYENLSLALGLVVLRTFAQNPKALVLLALQVRIDDSSRNGGAAIQRWLQLIQDERTYSSSTSQKGSNECQRGRSRSPLATRTAANNGSLETPFFAKCIISRSSALKALAGNQHLRWLNVAGSKGAIECCEHAEHELWICGNSAEVVNEALNQDPF